MEKVKTHTVTEMRQKRWELGKEGGQEENLPFADAASHCICSRASEPPPCTNSSGFCSFQTSRYCSQLQRTLLDRTVASKCTILSRDQLPRQAWFSCSLKVNTYFSLLLLLILASLRHSSFRLTKISDSDHLPGEMIPNKVWLVNKRGIFNGLHHQGLGAS